MKLPRAAAIAIGLLLAQQAQAGSFVVLGDRAVVNSPSVVMLGRPASPLAAADGHAAMPPDRGIETSALRTSLDGRGEAAHTLAAPAPEARHVVAWPPVLSRSMVAFGKPLPAKPRTAASGNRAPLSLPAVFRAGLAGDAFKSAPTPARAAVQEERPVEPKPADGRPTQPDAPAMTERRETPPPQRRDRPPAPEAPSAPPPPPPTMRLE